MEMEKLQELHSVLCSSSSSFASNLHPADIGAEEWERAERRVDEILSVIQPTVMSERRRKEIIEYIQILIGASYGIKVFPFGSVPLKTYLPDGDIDLSAVCYHDVELVSSIFCSLLHNEATTNHQILVRNVHCVPAQVKVVKCYVEGISVDISFNQIDGLCALSFLEQVDQLIGKDHLFKRSIILVKAWCFYESRILGAHFGLISTYALETMVAHIINLFHSSLHSPLGVLYKFLGYYSKFDWENHCVAIDGLVHISSLPEVVATPPDKSDEMLLSAEFLQKCRQAYSYATGINQTGGRPFHVKFLNVVDPLRDNNNIGRSINKASFNRIKFALKFATQKLKAILASPVEEVTKGVESFFKTTLGRNGVPVPEQSERLSQDNENLLAGIQYGLWFHDFGIFQGCNDPMFLEMWHKCDQLGLGGRYDLNALFHVNENVLGVTKVAVLGDMVKSRGTGTYIPQVFYEERMPFEQSRRRGNSPRVYKPLGEDVCAEVEYETTQTSQELDVKCDLFESPLPITIAEAEEEEEEEEVKMMMEEKVIPPPVLGDMNLGDKTEFPPLQGKPQKDASARK